MDRKSRYVRNLVLIVVSLAALGSGGCLIVAAGGAAGAAALGYAYSQGDKCQLYAASLDDSWTATRAALTDLGMPLVEEKREAGKGFFRSQTSDGETVRINLFVEASKFPADGPQTRVCVRVGVFGDHPASVRIFDQLGAHLTAVTPAGGHLQPVPATPPAVPTIVAPGPPNLPPTAPPPLLAPEPVPRPAIPGRP